MQTAKQTVLLQSTFQLHLSLNLSAANIRKGSTIAGVAGTIEFPDQIAVASGVGYGAEGTEFTGSSAEIPATCSTDGQIGCITTVAFKAANLVSAADKLLSGTILAGVAGNVTLPAANKVLSDTSFGVLDGTQGTVEDCSSNGDNNCYVDSSSIYDAADLSNLLEENIKSGVTIAGTAGDYPSSTYPLDSASATPDLDTATFNAKIKSSASFEYWTSAGVHHTNTGDANIIEANIKDGVTIFGATGTYRGPPAPLVILFQQNSITQIDHTWDLSIRG